MEISTWDPVRSGFKSQLSLSLRLGFFICEMGRLVSTFRAGGAWHAAGTSSVLIPFLSLARTIFLRLASLLVLIFSLWKQITCGGNAEADKCKTCGYNYELPVRKTGQESWVLEGKEKLGGSRLLAWEEEGAWGARIPFP